MLIPVMLFHANFVHAQLIWTLPDDDDDEVHPNGVAFGAKKTRELF